VTRVLLLAILLLSLAWAFWRMVDGVIEAFGGTSSKPGRRRGPTPMKLVRDPVCGTWVSPENARVVRAGSAVHFFCSDACREKFQQRS
jgi:YHS domain-containing protein